MSLPLKTLNFKCLTHSEIKLAVLAYCLPLAVGQSTWDDWRNIVRLFMKYYNAQVFFRYLIMYFTLGQNGTNIMDTLRFLLYIARDTESAIKQKDL